MTENMTVRSIARVVIGILISLAALIGLILLTDFQQIQDAFRQARLVVLLPGIGLVIAALFTRAYAWRGILRERITIWQSYLIINTGYFVNTILPFRLGEFSRAFLLAPSGLNFWQALPTIALERLIDVLFALSLFFIGLPSALDFQLDLVNYGLIAGGVLLLLVLLFWAVRNGEGIISWLNNTTFLGDALKNRLVKLAQYLLSSIQVLTDPVRMVQVLTGMAISWGIALGLQFLLLRAFLPESEFIWAVFALGAVAIGVSVPSSPGNIGIYEASITLALSAFDVDQSLAFSYALTSHFLNLIVYTIFGSYGLVRQGVRLTEVWQFGIRQGRGEDL